jgi:hypothetical protein
MTINKSLRRGIRYAIALIFLVNVFFVWALLTRHLPTDKDGYRYEYTGGQIMQIKDFVSPPGTVYMTKKVGDQTIGYYAAPPEK